MLRPCPRDGEGSRYTSIRSSERISTAGITPSVGAVGSSYDKALAETINGLYKTEVIRHQGLWRGVDQVEHATAEWVDWFNTTRLFEYCDDIPPVELEHAHYHEKQPPTEAAQSNNQGFRNCRGGSKWPPPCCLNESVG